MTTITNRLLILLGVLLAGLGSLYILPKYHGSQPVGISLVLPSDVGPWHGEDTEVTEKEKQVLGRGTEFARKLYRLPNGAGIFVSIVLSGQDVDTALHRPQRCLPAQGWTIIGTDVEPVPMEAGKPIKVTRLHTVGERYDASNHAVKVYGMYYYWFVGCSDVVATPEQRAMIDWRDRIFHGYDQRWAYVTVVVTMRDDSDKAREGADAAAKQFIAELFPKIWKPEGSKG